MKRHSKLEERIAERAADLLPAGIALSHLQSELACGRIATFWAEVVGTVEYRQGEGMAFEVRRGRVRVDTNLSDAVLSWADEKHRNDAAIPYANFSRYVAEGAIRLALQRLVP